VHSHDYSYQSPGPINDVVIQLSFDYEITPNLHASQTKFGADPRDSSVRSFAMVSDIRLSELSLSPNGTTLRPFSPGPARDPCWPIPDKAHDWPYRDPHNANCAGGCSVQYILAPTLEKGKTAMIQTYLTTFPNSTVADRVLAQMKPSFYCMGSHEADPARLGQIPQPDRQVLAAFVPSPPIICEGDCTPIGACPCQNGGSCASIWSTPCECLQGFWGEFCEHECACEAGSCDPLTGKCDCITGIDVCGPTCATSCRCLNDGWCNPETCECSCKPPYHGKDCGRSHATRCKAGGEAETSVKHN